jgi:hypothetical protein
VQLALKEHKVLRVLLVLQVFREHKVQLALKEHKVLRVLRVLLVHQA